MIRKDLEPFQALDRVWLLYLKQSFRLQNRAVLAGERKQGFEPQKPGCSGHCHLSGPPAQLVDSFAKCCQIARAALSLC